MTLWNFLGELAIFNWISKLFSGKSKSNHTISHQPLEAYNEARIEELEQEINDSKERISKYQAIIDNNPSVNADDYDIDELQDLIDDLESNLDDCDEMSDRYYAIQDELDLLQDRLDTMEELEDTYDDLNLYDDDHYMDFDRDDDW